MVGLMSFRHSEKDVREEIQRMSKAPVRRYECPCGCGAGVQYSRDVSVLHIAFEFSPFPFLAVISCRTIEEFDQFLSSLPPNDLSRDVLIDAFFEGSN